MTELLTVTDVMERYNIERHSAGKIIRQLPYFKIGNKLFIRSNDLYEWERNRTFYPVVSLPRRKASVRLERRRS